MKFFWCPQVVEGSLAVKYRNGCEAFKRKSLTVFKRGVNRTKRLKCLNRPSSPFTYILLPSSTFIYLHQLSLIFASSTSTSLHSPSCTLLYLVFIYLYSASSTFTSLHLPSSNFIYLHQPSLTFINLHPLHLPLLTFIYLHSPSSTLCTFTSLHLPLFIIFIYLH